MPWIFFSILKGKLKFSEFENVKSLALKYRFKTSYIKSLGKRIARGNTNTLIRIK